MTTLLLTKIIGFACIGLVFLAMFVPGTYTILAGICILLPLALWDRKLMESEENETQEHLKKYSAKVGFRGTCYEGDKEVRSRDVCEILFKGKEILIFAGKDVSDLKHREVISKADIVDVQKLNLREVKEIAQTELYESLGALGKYYYTTVDKTNVAKKTRKDRNVSYLFIRYKNEKGKTKVISFFEGREFAYFNRRATKTIDINKYCEENYK